MKKFKIGKKTGLRYFGMEELRSFQPCYDPSRHLAEDFRGTAVTILDSESIPPQDKVWVVLRMTLVSEKLMRLFAVWCVRQALSKVSKTDPRSFKACDVAERFAHGNATKAELDQARSDAYAARRELYYAATATAYADDAADAATAAADAATATATAAYADDATAYATTATAAYAATATARQQVRTAARNEQVIKLREMVIAEGLERITAKRGVK